MKFYITIVVVVVVVVVIIFIIIFLFKYVPETKWFTIVRGNNSQLTHNFVLHALKECLVGLDGGAVYKNPG